MFPTLTRIPRYILYQVLGVAALLIFAPLFVMFVPVLVAFLLGLLVVIVIAGGDGTISRARLAWECLVLVGLLVPVFAMLRGATVLLWHLTENGMRVFNVWLQPLVWWGGEQAIAWLDLGLAVCGAAVIVVFTVQDSFWRVAQQRQVSNLPRSRARSLAMGLVRLQGVARPAEAAEDPSGPILRVSLMRDGYVPGPGPAAAEDGHFWLEDETGRVKISTQGARLHVDPDVQMGVSYFGGHSGMVRGLTDSGTCEVVLDRKHDDYPKEFLLMPGDPVFVLGIAQPETGAIDAAPIIRPERHLFGDHYHQVFFLSNGGDLPRRYFYHSFFHGWVFAAVALVFCIVLAQHGWTGLRDFSTAYGYTDEQADDTFTYDPFRYPVEKRWWFFRGQRTTTLELIRRFQEMDALELSQSLDLLERLQAQALARPALEEIILGGRRDMHLNLARGRLKKWGYSVPEPPLTDFAIVRFRGQEKRLEQDAAQALARQLHWLLRSCQVHDWRGGLTEGWKQAGTEDRISVRFAEPVEVPARGVLRSQQVESVTVPLADVEAGFSALVLGSSRILRYSDCNPAAVHGLLCGGDWVDLAKSMAPCR